jgi:hypothetical protein
VTDLDYKSATSEPLAGGFVHRFNHLVAAVICTIVAR